jgi:hypothetical protein
MKVFSIVVLVICLIGVGVLGYYYYDTNQQLQASKGMILLLDKEIVQLNSDYTKLVADNAKYMKQANLKSFTTLKELERFVKADTTDQEFKNDYASRACINMMVNAREQGYWLGMGVLNQSQENLYVAMLKDRENGGMSWTTYCLAVVGDADLYMVDPQNDGYIFSVMTMSADWADYSGRTVDFK